MKYVAVDENKQLRIINLQELNPAWMVVGEISYDQEEKDDPLVYLINPYTTPTDFMWPENMFDYSKQIRLSELSKTIEVIA